MRSGRRLEVRNSSCLFCFLQSMPQKKAPIRRRRKNREEAIGGKGLGKY
jgi:hypothetical protein